MKPQLSILKVGGKVLDHPEHLEQILSYFTDLKGAKILVHGGGKKADQVLDQMGMKVRMVAGRRLTDAPTLEVVTMVYAGLLNKQVVAHLQAKDCMALGLSGADGNLIQSRLRPSGDIEYGFAGDIVRVNDQLLHQLLQMDISPVCCAITHNKEGQLLNTNADTISASLAAALSSHYSISLQYCFEKPGVLLDPDDDTSSIDKLNPAEYIALREDGQIKDGMIPKLDNAFASLANGVEEVVLGNVESLLEGKGTVLRSEGRGAGSE